MNSLKEDKKKEAVKKVIALMTVGKDVSMLFTDVLKCITTTNLELKKLVYLYVMNYASSNSDDAILAVNTFLQDCTDTNPLIRALALRTMGCLRVIKIVEYICEPLRLGLKDSDPYVAKTAAICVAKLYDLNPSLVETQGFITLLRELISSNNPTVVSNAVAALSEIDEVSPEPVFVLTRTELSKLLTALEECTEWGQIYILSSLSKYSVKDDDEALRIVEKVTPRLQHANSAVVLASIKVLMKHIDRLEREKQKEITKKMRPTLVTMLSKEPEIQYVALRNINLILQKRPNLLANVTQSFFCNYSDPLYVKMEKLEIMIMLISEKNIDQVLVELKEYCNRSDVDFVRKSVRAIGRAAVKLPKSSEKCVQVLLELIKTTKHRYVIQESVVVIKDVLRRYGHEYDHVIETLLDEGLVEQLDEPEAKASIVWIIGEFSEKIKNINSVIQGFLSGFKEESPNVQLQLLTTVVKLFLKDPESTQQMVTNTLEVGMNEIENPDTRDRAYLYWRLLTIHPSAAKSVVASLRPLMSDDSDNLEPSVLTELLGNISTLASVYHKPPSTFMKVYRKKPEDEEEDAAEKSENLINDDSSFIGEGPSAPAAQQQDLLLVTAQSGHGLEIRGKFVPKSEGLVDLKLSLSNQSLLPVTEFQIKFKPNIYQLTPPQNLSASNINPNHSSTLTITCPISPNPPSPLPSPSPEIQAALRTNLGVCYFTAPLPLSILLSPAGRLEKDVWVGHWRSLTKELYFDLQLTGDFAEKQPALTETFFDPFAQPAAPTVSTATLIPKIQAKLEANKVFFVATKNIQGQDFLYLSAKTIDGSIFLLEVSKVVFPTAKVCIKTPSEHLAPLLAQALNEFLSK
uniref:Beta-adaptin appendage C-terminal subdomain domain-containing protein n=1 Tax=Arcella intermedia TaxID=1963864 RepID=A0A6B2KXR6_9EUKA